MCDVDDLEPRVRHVRDTWTKRCDITLFHAAEENTSFPTIGHNVSAGRKHIATKAKAAWKYIYAHHYNDADFFMKADPDTYAIIENIKHFLSSKNTSEPVIYGHRIGKNLEVPYMHGGPGEILTKEALKRLVTQAYELPDDCTPDGTGKKANIFDKPFCDIP